MLQHEFATLLDHPLVVPDPQSVEVSRLATCSTSSAARMESLLLLFRLWLRVALESDVRHAYCVMNDRFLPHFAALEEPAAQLLSPLGPWRTLGPDRPCRAFRLDVPRVRTELPLIAADLATFLGVERPSGG